MRRFAVASVVLLGSCGGRPASVPGPASPASPSGAATAIAVGNGDVMLGALPAGQLARIGGPRLSHHRGIKQVAVAAGGEIVSAGGPQVRVWSPATGQLRWQTFAPLGEPRFALTFDGREIAVSQEEVGSSGGRVAIYDLGGVQRGSFATRLAGALAFSPDDSKLAIIDSSVDVHDVKSGQRLGGSGISALAAGFDSAETVVLVSRDAVRRWTWSRLNQVAIVMPFAAPPDVVALSRDATRLAWSVGNTVEVAELEAPASRRTLVAPSPVRALALTPEAGTLAVSWEGGNAVWDLEDPPRQRWQLATKSKLRSAIAFSNTGKTLVVTDVDGIYALDATTGAYDLVPGARTDFGGFAADGNPILWRGATSEILDVRTGKRRAAGDEPAGAPSWTDSSLYGADGVATAWRLVSTYDCRPLKVWVSGRGEQLVQPAPRCGEYVEPEWFFGPGFVVSGSVGAEVWDVWGGPDGKGAGGNGEAALRPRMILPPLPRPRIDLSFSADRRWLVTVYGPIEEDESDDDEDEDGDPFPEEKGNLVEVYDVPAAAPGASGRPVRELTWTGAIELTAVAILGDGTIFAGCSDGAVLVAAPGETAFREAGRLSGPIERLEASPTGTAVAATDEDRLTVLFTGAATGGAGKAP